MAHVIKRRKIKPNGTIQLTSFHMMKKLIPILFVSGTNTDIDYDTMNAEVTVSTKNAITGVLTANVQCQRITSLTTMR